MKSDEIANSQLRQKLSCHQQQKHRRWNPGLRGSCSPTVPCRWLPPRGCETLTLDAGDDRRGHMASISERLARCCVHHVDVNAASYEEWQFRRHFPLHLMLMTVGLAYAVSSAIVNSASRALQSEPISTGASFAYLVLFSMQLAVRLAAHSWPAKPLLRHICVNSFAVFVLISAVFDTIFFSTMGHSVKPARWVGRVLAGAPFITGHAVLAGTSAGWPLPFAFAFVCTLVSFAILTQTVPDDIETAQFYAGASLLSTWMISFIMFIFLDAHGRAQFVGEKAMVGWADAKGRYIAAVSHDFGTPISVMRVLVSNIQDDAQLCERIGVRSLNGIQASLDLLSTVRQKAINLNQLERGQQLQPDRAACSFPELMNQLMLMVDHMPRRSTVRFELSMDDALQGSAMVITDRGWLQLMAMNLLTNAFKHTSQGAVCLKVSVEDGGNTMRLRVSDTGRGVPAEDIPSLFTPYQQASKWRFGTGLGLFHVRELAQALGGTVGYEANTPCGAVFWMDIPLVLANDSEVQLALALGADQPVSAASSSGAAGVVADEEANAEAIEVNIQVQGASANDGGMRSALPESPPLEQDAPFANLSVLVVEDEAFFRASITTLLEACGTELVEVACDGELGVAHLTSGDRFFHLALVDLQMPIMDGFECVRRARAYESSSAPDRTRTRFVAVSANADDPDIQDECLACGFDRVIPKPLNLSKVRELLQEVHKGT